MRLKIALIGAGSVVFAKNLIGDILQFPELSDCTLCLMDIDPARLKVAEVMATRMIRALKVKATVVATLDRREAIRNARYVICTIQVGGYKPGTVTDFEIPRKYGLLQTIGDTLGVGGVFRALRTIPAMTEIARDIAGVGAPGCLLLNYSNPMAMNCMAVAQAAGIPHVGLCHSVQGTSQQLASYLGLPYEDITYLSAGINHMAFFLKFQYRGQDAYPLLFDLLAGGFARDRVRFEMMRRLGYFVTESSEHQSEYTPYFIHHGREVIKRFEVPIDEYLRRSEIGLRSWKDTEAKLLGEEGDMKINPQTHEYGAYIIHSCETNTPRVIYGNVPNTGLIDNLPGNACVEVPCLVDAQGMQPTHIGALPPQLAAICQTNINVQTLAVEAALTRKREHIYHAVMLDPHASSVLPLDRIWAMCDELIAAHQKHGLLGEFAPCLPHTGRAFAGTGDRIFAEARLGQDDGKDGKLPAEVILRNPGQRTATVKMAVAATNLPAGDIFVQQHVAVKVPPGKTVKKRVSLPWPHSDREGLVLKLIADTPDIFTRDFQVLRRLQLAAGGKEGVPFELKLAGTPAVEANLAVRKNVISARFAVEDSKIRPSPRPWEGSGIELFVALDERSPICQICIVPGAAGRGVRVLDRHLKPLAKTRARISPRRGIGYEVNVELPFESLQLPNGTRQFLFDAIVNVGALGDAHGGGRTSLSGKSDSHQNSTFFARVTF